MGRRCGKSLGQDGRLVEATTVPGVAQVGSRAFGGNKRSVLYITTCRKNLPMGQQPDAGAAFRYGQRFEAQP